ncbi:MAG: FRG domain-containing protein [Candidatus Poribacteria bacterium]|nr:FRG domain-containing protein [Candidatus Poribacteria bacterium]
MSKYQTQPIKMAPYQIQTVSLKELPSGSELIEFLRVEIPYGKTYGRIPFARVLYAFNGVEQKKAVPIDLDKGAFSDSSFENVFEDEELEKTFRKIAPEVFRNAAPQIVEVVSKAATLRQSLEKRKINTLNDFMEWVESINPDLESERYLFRGLSNEKYPIEASAWRRLPPEYNRSSYEEFLEINKFLIKEARLQGHDHKNGRELKDLEILAELQHLGAATCLIDFTYNPQIALWFACQPNSGNPSDGKVGAVLNNPNRIEEITPKMLEERDFDSFFNAPSQKLWQPQLFRWQPRHLNNRIVSQHSIFLLGGNQVIHSDEECIIEASCKEEILKSLEICSHITEKRLFPDLEGFARQHADDKPFPVPDYLVLGHQASQRQEYEEAISNYSKAIRWNPKDANPYFWRGHAKVAIEKYREAIDDFDEIIRIEDNVASVYQIRGYAKSRLGLYSDAKQDYLKGLQLAQQANNEQHVKIIQEALHELNSHTTSGTQS